MGSSSPNLVLLTGSTGYIGFRTLVEVLKAGYRVRAAVRNQSGIEKVQKAPSIKPYLSQLEFVLVPDILKEDAYYEAVKEVDLIVHLASPTTNQAVTPTEETYDAIFVQPALQGTKNMLWAAKKFSPTTRRIVITASIVSLLPPSEIVAETGRVINEQSRTTNPKLPYGGVFVAYSASKIEALNYTEDFVRTEKPHFDINHIGPGYTIGANELATTRKELIAGTNGAAMSVLLGIEQGDTPSTSVHVNDIAKMHVLALDPKVAGGQFFIGVGENSNTVWDDAIRIAKKALPEGFQNGTFKDTGSRTTKKITFDTTFTRKALGIEFAGYEEQVKSVAAQYLALED